MAAVSHGACHVTTKQCCKYAASVDTQNVLCKATVTDSELRATRAHRVCSEAENNQAYSATKNDQSVKSVKIMLSAAASLLNFLFCFFFSVVLVFCVTHSQCK